MINTTTARRKPRPIRADPVAPGIPDRLGVVGSDASVAAPPPPDDDADDETDDGEIDDDSLDVDPDEPDDGDLDDEIDDGDFDEDERGDIDDDGGRGPRDAREITIKGAHVTAGDDTGQATTEYALVLLGAALVALLLIGWATAGGGAGKIGHLLDHVLDTITSKL